MSALHFDFSSLEQLEGLWNIFGTKVSVYGAIFSNFQAERQSNHQELWSGRWESNPRPKLGKPQLIYKNVRIGGILTFWGFLKWIPIGAGSGWSSRMKRPGKPPVRDTHLLSF